MEGNRNYYDDGDLQELLHLNEIEGFKHVNFNRN